MEKVDRAAPDDAPSQPWRQRLHRVIWDTDTPAGVLFDKIVVVAILVSVAVVLLDSMQRPHLLFRDVFTVTEWLFTLLFTAEYIARLVSVKRPLKYALSFFGIVDLLAVLPTYLALFLPELHALIDVRILRLLRIFRILRLTAYVAEYQVMGEALWASRRKILVFLAAVLMINLVMGTLMYVVEGPENGFVNIPTSVYWAISTMTTVGFGDIVPKTGFGRGIASTMMLLGWGTLAVPTGIVTAEMTVRRHARPLLTTRTCTACGAAGYGAEARFCQQCGTALPPQTGQHANMNSRQPWYRSVAVKSCLIAFVATHIPLLGLIAIIVIHPDWLSPWGVFLAALVFTLLATGFVVTVLWRMFRPLREAADGLRIFMSEGKLFVPTGGGRDEVGRMVQTLVKSLAHLERGRAPLLDAGAFALYNHGESSGPMAPRGWLALVEVDQWEALDREGLPRDLLAVQKAMAASLQAVITEEEILMPWGRGRCLVLLLGSGAAVHERLEKVCQRVSFGQSDNYLTASAVVEPSEAGNRSWAAGLQRLENKLFTLRLEGLQAKVA